MHSIQYDIGDKMARLLRGTAPGGQARCSQKRFFSEMSSMCTVTTHGETGANLNASRNYTASPFPRPDERGAGTTPLLGGGSRGTEAQAAQPAAGRARIRGQAVTPNEFRLVSQNMPDKQ